MRYMGGILSAALAAFLISAPARAAVVYSIQPVTVAATPGETNGAFEVLLTNTGSSISVSGFTFEVSVTDPDITLTSADFSTTDPYIFAGMSFDESIPIPLNYTSGETLDASDTSSGSAVTVGTGVSFALGEVYFSVSPTAMPGTFPVSFTSSVNGDNSLSNAAGGPIAIDTLTGGNIMIVTPEPSTLALMLAGAVLLLGLRVRARLRVTQL